MTDHSAPRSARRRAARLHPGGCGGGGPVGAVMVAALLFVLGVGAAIQFQSRGAPTLTREVEEKICQVGAIFLGGTCPDENSDLPPAALPALSVPYHDPAIDRAKALATTGTVAGAEDLNDWDCKPGSPEHPQPHPVILVHGTGFPGYRNFKALAPLLISQGYCVFALDYGAGIGPTGLGYGYGPIAGSAEQLRIFVDGVLAATGADKVDLVGHSQGGLMARYYIRFLGGADKVNHLIALAPPNHGTNNQLVRAMGWMYAGLRDQVAGSSFLRKLNAGRDVEPGVLYTVIATEYDEVVTPYESQFLNGPADQVTNITLQDHFPGYHIPTSGSGWTSEHGALIDDPYAMQFVLDALRRGGWLPPPPP